MRAHIRKNSLPRSVIVMFMILLVLSSHDLFPQTNPDFNVTLRLDFASIDGLINLKEGQIADANDVAQLRGNQIAAATSALLARQPYSADAFSVNSTVSPTVHPLRKICSG